MRKIKRIKQSIEIERLIFRMDRMERKLDSVIEFFGIQQMSYIKPGRAWFGSSVDEMEEDAMVGSFMDTVGKDTKQEADEFIDGIEKGLIGRRNPPQNCRSVETPILSEEEAKEYNKMTEAEAEEYSRQWEERHILKKKRF